MNAITDAQETIEVAITETDQPIQLDLNQIFTASVCATPSLSNLMESCCVRTAANSALLYLSLGEHAEAGSRTRLVVRADNGTGCSAAVIFKVSMIDSAVEVSRVA
ncbi:MAG: hypothetical protein ACI8Z5_002273 [Lentimonas sp.]|jgi:hypothetical protein